MTADELLGWWLWVVRFFSNITPDIKEGGSRGGGPFPVVPVFLYSRSISESARSVNGERCRAASETAAHAVNAYERDHWPHVLREFASSVDIARDRDGRVLLVVADSVGGNHNPCAGPGDSA